MFDKMKHVYYWHKGRFCVAQETTYSFPANSNGTSRFRIENGFREEITELTREDMETLICLLQDALGETTGVAQNV